MANQIPPHSDSSSNDPQQNEILEKEASTALEQGDKEKIDRKLDELHVSTTDSGRDQSHDEDTEGSTSSSKNLDKQSE
ncbi:hypothetical protein QCE63_34690 [Caballeronia sp. LZ065]|uniref:hypothetical protein n=1 Tax=Caballeronia sp. LZ065 TaxID=3038571 RepID=UPI0028656D35|nr:hypothetical protein [Caballeronia sp. LZ065]MDR5784552.1 hypothetical protein [Caballeronia sp. LZ065]